MYKLISLSCIIYSLYRIPSLTYSTSSLNLGDTSYVVEIHSSAESFAQSSKAVNLDDSSAVLMTAKNGKRFACYLPPTIDPSEESGEDLLVRFRQAKSKFSSCLIWPDNIDNEIYEICPSMSIRKINKETQEAKSLGDYQSDMLQELFSFGIGQTCLASASEALSKLSEKTKIYTQVFGNNNIHVQYICGVKDEIGELLKDEKGDLFFLVLSPFFCDSLNDEAGDDVQKYLLPMVISNLCIMKKEGWWTYEFCFGRELRQYHAEVNGEIVSEFSLGKFDKELNDQREKEKQTIVSDSLDATQDIAKTAYKQLFLDGTPCQENGEGRSTEVFFYCNPMSSMHYIHSVKETQTCKYTLKVSTPSVCAHPRFALEESKVKETSLAVHCIPYQEEKI